jgi:hypothetical protein
LEGLTKIVLKERLREKFNSELTKLSARAQNILEDSGILLFDFFYDQYFIKQTKINFKNVRNCGNKTKIELDQFVNEICNSKEFELLAFQPIISVPQLLQRNPIIPLQFDFQTTLLFNEEFNKLSVRSKNVLSGIGSNLIDGFYNKVYFEDAKAILSLRNCGKESVLEILKFKMVFKELLEHSKKSTSENNSFKDLEVYFNHSICLKSVESEIFQNYYGFIKNYKKETLGEIAIRNNLSRERVRQISKSLIKRIQGIIINLSNIHKFDFQKYFINEYFVVNQEFADKINISENTSFSPRFIAYVLIFINNPEFDFLTIDENSLITNVFFIKRTIPFDFKRCFNHFSILIQSNKKIEIQIDDLLKSFQRECSLCSDSTAFGLDEKVQIINIIRLLISHFKYGEDQIDIINDLIIIRKTCRQLLHELLEKILDEYKKPMHFSEIFQECLKRGYKITSETSVHSTLTRRGDIFGLKGPGIYGLLEWGGYFGTIGDVAESILQEKKGPIPKRELEEILCRELYISKDSISVVLFGYELEDRFVKTKDDTVSLKKWNK